MAKSRVSLLGVLAIVLAAGVVFAGCSSDDSSSTEGDQTASSTTATKGGAEESQAMTDGQDTAMKKDAMKGGEGGDMAASQPGQYVDYSPELVASTKGDKLLFFHADWCSQCQALEEDIETSGVPDGVTIFKVDYDSNQDLRQEYGVTLQTTMVKVDDDGEKIDSYVAYEEPTLDSVTAALLQ